MFIMIFDHLRTPISKVNDALMEPLMEAAVLVIDDFDRLDNDILFSPSVCSVA